MLEAWIRADTEMQRTKRAIQEQRDQVEQAKKAALLLDFQRQIQEAQHLANSHNKNNNGEELHSQSNAESFNEQLRLAKEAALMGTTSEEGLLNLARFIPHHKVYIIGLAAILSLFLFRLYFHKNLRMAGRLQNSALGYLVSPSYQDGAVKVV